MPNNNVTSIHPENPGVSFFKRVLSSDSTKKGAAALVAGVVLAAVTEAIWPSNS
jgi:hypothetical protein